MVSNYSTASLLAATRKPNGSGLRHSANQTDYAQPVEILEKLLGIEAGEIRNATSNYEEIDEVEIEEELDFKSLSLFDLARFESSNSDDVHVYKPQAVDECMLSIDEKLLSAYSVP